MALLIDSNSPINKGGSTSPQIVDIANNPGQNGFTLSRVNWASNARYVKQRMIPILLNGPKLAKYLPEFDNFNKTLKSLIEERALTIQGINKTITVEYNETAEGNSGNFRETPTNGLYERSVPAFEWPEIFGKAINKFWEYYIRMLIIDPDTGLPGVAGLDAYRSDPNRLPLIEDNMSFTVLFVEPSADYTTVVSAALSANMMPKTGGEHTLSRMVGEAKEAPLVAIEFTAMTDHSDSVYVMAQERLDEISSQEIDPANLASLASYTSGVSEDIAAAENGFFSSTTE